MKEKDQEPTLPDHITGILDNFYDQYIEPAMEKLIRSWSVNSKDRGVYKDAIEFLTEALETKNTEESLKLFEIDVDNAGHKVSVEYFKQISTHCTGQISTNENIFKDCRRLCDLPDKELLVKMGQHWQNLASKFLCEERAKLEDSPKLSDAETPEPTSTLSTELTHLASEPALEPNLTPSQSQRRPRTSVSLDNIYGVINARTLQTEPQVDERGL